MNPILDAVLHLVWLLICFFLYIKIREREREGGGGGGGGVNKNGNLEVISFLGWTRT